ncbi:M20/M25/M40 family metallo-hydrolase [Sphingobacterium bovistauri]|uniref:M20/M25/M40 family metallo-hydrolase n=1 Tax=Sphingobacterium bovistauri TaxID=2781959 RepID=A0ABS7Z597_9SPHI|nr:M20/M25/M40 family metallo-hydrolase [Sphingobacterium bovistauri]MCA5005361.1 M20/M25/M40 family metallo-hydrolase [Sphingobacterium bovistauri]
MRLLTLLTSILLFNSVSSNAQQSDLQIVDSNEVKRILNTLASDDMGGRHAFTPFIGKAADFIAEEFKKNGLQPYSEANYRQTFHLSKVNRASSTVTLGTKEFDLGSYLIIGNEPHVHWNQSSAIPIKYIRKEDDFATTFRSLAQGQEDVIVIVDPSYASYITRFNKIYGKESITNEKQTKGYTKAFILTSELPSSYSISCTNISSKIELFNVAAVIPGKSKPNEYVIFSAHYDHIGIIQPNGQDSIANGADDDASGTSAIISLSKYYKNQNNNERTLIFVAFTAEEIGMYGSKYFSNNINADSVIAMINIEMIGKDSKFGANTLYLTGYDHSNLGELMQQNLKNTEFKFHPDPYPQQNLFYRSDNAVLAALGVPAHTFSTSQIDKDSYYHTVKDDVSTLNIENIVSSIEAIALGAQGIVNGTQTPNRVEKLKD